jgi:hypothetical protein
MAAVAHSYAFEPGKKHRRFFVPTSRDKNSSNLVILLSIIQALFEFRPRWFLNCSVVLHWFWCLASMPSLFLTHLSPCTIIPKSSDLCVHEMIQLLIGQSQPQSRGWPLLGTPIQPASVLETAWTKATVCLITLFRNSVILTKKIDFRSALQSLRSFIPVSLEPRRMVGRCISENVPIRVVLGCSHKRCA